MSLKPYPKYKDSGVEWMGDIPREWTVQRLWTLFNREKNVGYPTERMLSVFRDYGVIPKDSRENFNKTAENRDIYQLVDRGWLVSNRMKAWQGSVGISAYRGIVSGHYICFRPNHGESSVYLNYLFRSERYAAGYRSISRGVRIGQAEIDNDQYKLLPVLLPSKSEQAAIADFLDREVAEIDAFIADQEELITLLNERRAATITRAVTKGIDPTVPMKDSGFVWLGHVPLSWEVTYLKHAIEALPGYAFKSEEFSADEDDIRLLRGVNINPDRIVWGDVVRFDRNRAVEVAAYGLREGDLVLGLDRPIVAGGMRIASIGEEDLPSFVLQRVARIRSNSRAVQGFIRYLLHSKVFQDYLAPVFTGVSVPHMSTGQLGEFGIGLPDPSVQLAIVGHLDAELAEIDATIADAKDAIALSKERRAALISAAVTGQIDVRDAMAAKHQLLEGELVVH